jgi:hypothetical protein
MLKEILKLDSGILMVSGGSKRLASLYLRSWGRGRRVIVERPDFALAEGFYIGDPLRARGFDVYLLMNPISGLKGRREAILRWLEDIRRGESKKLVLLYEERYVGDSIVKYRIRNYLDYLLAYRRETVGFERIEAFHLEGGRVVEKKTYVRRPMRNGFGPEG